MKTILPRTRTLLLKLLHSPVALTLATMAFVAIGGDETAAIAPIVVASLRSRFPQRPEIE